MWEANEGLHDACHLQMPQTFLGLPAEEHCRDAVKAVQIFLGLPAEGHYRDAEKTALHLLEVDG